jgi:hypothetical protein
MGRNKRESKGLKKRKMGKDKFEGVEDEREKES